MTTRLDRPPDAQTAACPCRHGDVPAEIAGQRPLLERAAAGDREAFARLYDGQVEGVYRYLLAWTGDRPAARDLTEQVFRSALTWLPVTAGGEGEAGAWLVAMARDAIVQQRGSGWVAGPAGPGAAASREAAVGPDYRQAPDAVGPWSGDASREAAVGAVALLGDPEREVVVLRLLLGHSLAHTAHLSGYSQRAVIELQLAACLAIRDLTGPTSPAGPDGPGAAEELERRLGRWEIDPTGSHPGLAQALAVAASLRSAIPGYVVAPEDSFVQGLRQQLVAAPAPDPPGGGSPLRSAERAVVTAGRVSRRPWVATFIATAGIVGILALQAFGSPAPPSTCGGRPCPAPTTLNAAGGGGLGTPLTTVVREPTTTSSTLRGLLPSPTAPLASTATSPPTTRPATTAPQTTRAPRPTTTRAPTTTAPPTTAPPTTTTGPTTTT